MVGRKATTTEQESAIEWAEASAADWAEASVTLLASGSGLLLVLPEQESAIWLVWESAPKKADWKAKTTEHPKY
jgi:hypothetical protein